MLALVFTLTCFHCPILGRKFHPKLHGHNQAKLYLGNGGIQQVLQLTARQRASQVIFSRSAWMLIARRS
jgi:hypothetical protein